ncbi:hypothetical protein KC337_g66 [Hortaea werneckii]|nr:hypothetical protein KC337_g66 [Hortaea werneckii]
MASNRWLLEHLKRGWRSCGVLGKGLSLIVTLAHVSSCSILFSPAVSSALVASFGNCSRATDAAIVRGISDVFSSASTGASGGDAEDEVEVISAVLMGLTPAGWNLMKSRNVPINGCRRHEWHGKMGCCVQHTLSSPLTTMDLRLLYFFIHPRHSSILSEGQISTLRCGPILRGLLYLWTFAGL